MKPESERKPAGYMDPNNPTPNADKPWAQDLPCVVCMHLQTEDFGCMCGWLVNKWVRLSKLKEHRAER